MGKKMNEKSMHANPNKNRTPRHRAREFALQGIYQWLLNRNDARAVVANVRTAHGCDKADSEHFTALVMGVALATSVAFITPLGHPVNVLVMGPGGYKFGDYAKVGVLLTLITFGVILIFLPIFWPWK